MISTSQFAPKMGAKDFIAIACVILSLAIAAFVTYDQYYSYVGNRDTLEALSSDEGRKKVELDRLNALKQASSEEKTVAETERYAGEYREDIYASSLLSPIPGVAVSGISLDKGERLPTGFSAANISLSFQAQNQESLVKYLDYLTGADSKRRYFIRSITFPYDTSTLVSGAVNVSVKLGSYYLSR